MKRNFLGPSKITGTPMANANLNHSLDQFRKFLRVENKAEALCPSKHLNKIQ